MRKHSHVCLRLLYEREQRFSVSFCLCLPLCCHVSTNLRCICCSMAILRARPCNGVRRAQAKSLKRQALFRAMGGLEKSRGAGPFLWAQWGGCSKGPRPGLLGPGDIVKEYVPKLSTGPGLFWAHGGPAGPRPLRAQGGSFWLEPQGNEDRLGPYETKQPLDVPRQYLEPKWDLMIV